MFSINLRTNTKICFNIDVFNTNNNVGLIDETINDETLYPDLGLLKVVNP
jgi:hypothetical protein